MNLEQLRAMGLPVRDIGQSRVPAPPCHIRPRLATHQ